MRSITLAIQTHNFNKRLCWMLSSVMEQYGDIPDIKIRLSHIQDSGVNEIRDMFPSLRIELSTYPDHLYFQYRGLVRNRDLKDITGKPICDSDYILWADSDMVYPPNFFAELKKKVDPDEKRMYFSRRASTHLEPTDNLIDVYTYPCVIHDVWRKVSTLNSDLKSNIGAGYCHLANVSHLYNEHGGYYVDPAKNKDHAWSKYPKCRSDQQFRRRVGKCKIDLPVQIHLQHTRASENRECLEDAR